VQPLLLAGGGVATGAAGGVEHLLAILQVGGVVVGQRLGADGFGHRDDPEDSQADHGQDQDRGQELLHRRIPSITQISSGLSGRQT